MIRRWRAWIGLVLGIAVSGIFLWLALRQVNGQEFIVALEGANYLYVILTALALAAGLFLRSTRWRLIGSSSADLQGSYFRATNIGALCNLILPARAGEFVRIFTLARLTGTRLVNPVVSSLLDRFVDVVVLLLAAVGVYLLLPRDLVVVGWLGTTVVVSAAVIGSVIMIGLVMGRHHGWLTVLTERWLQSWRLRPDAFFVELKAETKQLLNGSLSFRLLGVVSLIILVDCIAVSSLLLAFHLELPILATVLLWVFLTIGSMLPSAPGYIGVYQTAAIWALSVFAVPPSSAVAVAVVLQAATLAVTFAMTGPSFWRLLKSALAAQRVEG